MDSKDDETMNYIKQVVRENSRVHQSFSQKQKQRIKELKAMRAAQLRGEDVDISSVIDDLQKSGYLDSKANISKHYR